VFKYRLDQIFKGNTGLLLRRRTTSTVSNRLIADNWYQ
jgi:hypothetical protein